MYKTIVYLYFTNKYFSDLFISLSKDDINTHFYILITYNKYIFINIITILQQFDKNHKAIINQSPQYHLIEDMRQRNCLVKIAYPKAGDIVYSAFGNTIKSFYLSWHTVFMFYLQANIVLYLIIL